MRAVPFAIIFLMILAIPVAAQIDYFNGMATLGDDRVEHHIVMRFSGPVNSLKWSLPFNVYNLKTEAEFQINCSAEKGIACTMSAQPNKTAILDFTSKAEVIEEDGKQIYRLDYTFPLAIESAIILIRLPERAVLAEEPVNASYLPADGNVMTDGKHIIVYWERKGLKAGDGLVFSVKYKAPKISTESYLWLVPIPIIIAIPIFLAILYLVIKRLRRQIITEVLLPEEKAIIDFLKQKGGKALQKQIARELDFSKAKVSRVLKVLRKKGLVHIEPVSGRENRVLLRYEKRKEDREEDSTGAH